MNQIFGIDTIGYLYCAEYDTHSLRVVARCKAYTKQGKPTKRNESFCARFGIGLSKMLLERKLATCDPLQAVFDEMLAGKLKVVRGD